jgi:hypothetical protein
VLFFGKELESEVAEIGAPPITNGAMRSAARRLRPSDSSSASWTRS